MSRQRFAVLTLFVPDEVGDEVLDEVLGNSIPDTLEQDVTVLALEALIPNVKPFTNVRLLDVKTICDNTWDIGPITSAGIIRNGEWIKVYDIEKEES